MILAVLCRGCTWCAGGVLTNFHCKLRLIFFTALGVQVHPWLRLWPPLHRDRAFLSPSDPPVGEFGGGLRRLRGHRLFWLCLHFSCRGRPVGQNGYYTHGRYRGPRAFRAWRREKNFWNFTSWTCTPNKTCGHWTQVSLCRDLKISCKQATFAWSVADTDSVSLRSCFRQPTVCILYCLLPKSDLHWLRSRTMTRQSAASALDVTLLLYAVSTHLNSF